MATKQPRKPYGRRRPNAEATSFEIGLPRSSDATVIPGRSKKVSAAEKDTPAHRPVTIEVMVRLQALAVPELDGGYSILVPALPGCVSQAETIEEARANVVEAAEGWLAAGHDHNKDEDLRVAMCG